MTLNAHAQAVLTGLEQYGKVAASQNSPYKNKIAKDSYGNAYICGGTWNVMGGNYDGFLQKLDKHGNTLWTQTLGSTNLDFFTNMFILHDTAIYLTGLKTNSSADLWTAKVTAAGVVRWENSFDGAYASYDCGGALIANDSGDVFVTGGSFNSSVLFSDMEVLKLANADGSILLSNFWDNPGYNLNDAANAVTFDTKYLFIGGVSQETGGYHYATVKFKLHNLVYSNSQVSAGTSSTTVDEVKDFKEDGTGIYLCGKISTSTSGYNMCVIKLDTALNTVFAVNFDGGNNLDDEFNGLVLDNSGNIFCTGYGSVTNINKKYVTMKLNSSGTWQWTKYYADSLNGDSEATGIAIDSAQNVYVTGFSPSVMNGLNFHTIKYLNGTGAEAWHIESDGNSHLSDIPFNIIVDDNDQSIIVSGQSQLPNGKYEYKTCKYVEREIITPTDLHNEPAAHSFLYYENKGQLQSSDSLPVSVPNERFYTNNTYPNLYFTNNSFSFVFSHINNVVAIHDTMQRVDVSFPGSDLDNAKIYPLEEQTPYLNYFTTLCPDGITEIHGNQRLVIPDLYYNIDLIYYSNDAGFKYYFIVKPGGELQI